jgi:NADPH2:quinone reductase
MRALVLSGFCSADHIRLAEVPMPQCEANDVLIRVAAAGVNPVDWKECEGYLEQFYGRYPDPWVPGYDAAGVVHQVGVGVTSFKIGDRVVAFSDRRESGHNGTFAEFVRVRSDAVSLVPDDVELTTAATLPTAGLTAYQAVTRPGKGALHPGDCVLIHGASGGVGSFAVQFAKAGGIEVAATCGSRNVDYVRSLGADLVLDHSAGGIVTAVRRWQPTGVKAVIDAVGGGTLTEALDALAPGGRLISITTLTQDGDVAGDIERAQRRGCTKIQSIIDFNRIGTDLKEMLDLLAARRIAPLPLETFSFEQGREALTHMKAGGVRGKIALVMEGAHAA